MRICITGFFGFANCGDEGILRAMIDSLGREHEYVVCTTMPFDRMEQYRQSLPYCVDEVRQVNDTRCDYNAFLLGGGGLVWGYGWSQALVALKKVPSMIYGVGFTKKPLYNRKLHPLYNAFFRMFDAISVRDRYSQNLLCETLDASAVVTMCPSINLKETKWDCPENTVIVCPRSEDYRSNEAQTKYLIKYLKPVKEQIILVPFAPVDLWGSPVDL